MAYLAYIKDMFGIHAQIIYDEAMFEYSKRHDVVATHKLTEEETELFLDELTQKHPYTETKTGEDK